MPSQGLKKGGSFKRAFFSPWTHSTKSDHLISTQKNELTAPKTSTHAAGLISKIPTFANATASKKQHHAESESQNRHFVAESLADRPQNGENNSFVESVSPTSIEHHTTDTKAEPVRPQYSVASSTQWEGNMFVPAVSVPENFSDRHPGDFRSTNNPVIIGNSPLMTEVPYFNPAFFTNEIFPVSQTDNLFSPALSLPYNYNAQNFGIMENSINHVSLEENSYLFLPQMVNYYHPQTIDRECYVSTNCLSDLCQESTAQHYQDFCNSNISPTVAVPASPDTVFAQGGCDPFGLISNKQQVHAQPWHRDAALVSTQTEPSHFNIERSPQSPTDKVPERTIVTSHQKTLTTPQMLHKQHHDKIRNQLVTTPTLTREQTIDGSALENSEPRPERRFLSKLFDRRSKHPHKHKGNVGNSASHKVSGSVMQPLQDDIDSAGPQHLESIEDWIKRLSAEIGLDKPESQPLLNISLNESSFEESTWLPKYHQKEADTIYEIIPDSMSPDNTLIIKKQSISNNQSTSISSPICQHIAGPQSRLKDRLFLPIEKRHAQVVEKVDTLSPQSLIPIPSKSSPFDNVLFSESEKRSQKRLTQDIEDTPLLHQDSPLRTTSPLHVPLSPYSHDVQPDDVWQLRTPGTICGKIESSVEEDVFYFDMDPDIDDLTVSKLLHNEVTETPQQSVDHSANILGMIPSSLDLNNSPATQPSKSILVEGSESDTLTNHSNDNNKNITIKTSDNMLQKNLETTLYGDKHVSNISRVSIPAINHYPAKYHHSRKHYPQCKDEVKVDLITSEEQSMHAKNRPSKILPVKHVARKKNNETKKPLVTHENKQEIKLENGSNRVSKKLKTNKTSTENDAVIHSSSQLLTNNVTPSKQIPFYTKQMKKDISAEDSAAKKIVTKQLPLNKAMSHNCKNSCSFIIPELGIKEASMNLKQTSTKSEQTSKEPELGIKQISTHSEQTSKEPELGIKQISTKSEQSSKEPELGIKQISTKSEQSSKEPELGIKQISTHSEQTTNEPELGIIQISTKSEQTSKEPELGITQISTKPELETKHTSTKPKLGMAQISTKSEKTSTESESTNPEFRLQQALSKSDQTTVKSEQKSTKSEQTSTKSEQTSTKSEQTSTKSGLALTEPAPDIEQTSTNYDFALEEMSMEPAIAIGGTSTECKIANKEMSINSLNVKSTSAETDIAVEEWSMEYFCVNEEASLFTKQIKDVQAHNKHAINKEDNKTKREECNEDSLSTRKQKIGPLRKADYYVSSTASTRSKGLAPTSQQSVKISAAHDQINESPKESSAGKGVRLPAKVGLKKSGGSRLRMRGLTTPGSYSSRSTSPPLPNSEASIDEERPCSNVISHVANITKGSFVSKLPRKSPLSSSASQKQNEAETTPFQEKTSLPQVKSDILKSPDTIPAPVMILEDQGKRVTEDYKTFVIDSNPNHLVVTLENHEDTCSNLQEENGSNGKANKSTSPFEIECITHTADGIVQTSGSLLFLNNDLIPLCLCICRPYMEAEIEKLQEKLQKELAANEMERLNVARLQKQLLSSQANDSLKDVIQRELEGERAVRDAAEQKIQQLLTENQLTQSRLSSLQEQLQRLNINRATSLNNNSNQSTKEFIQNYKVENKFHHLLSSLEEENQLLQNELEDLEKDSTPKATKTTGMKVSEDDQLLNRIQTLEFENVNLNAQTSHQRNDYERCLDDISKQVISALITQKDLRTECRSLQGRVTDLEEQNRALRRMVDSAVGAIISPNPLAADSHAPDTNQLQENQDLSVQKTLDGQYDYFRKQLSLRLLAHLSGAIQPVSRQPPDNLPIYNQPPDIPDQSRSYEANSSQINYGRTESSKLHSTELTSPRLSAANYALRFNNFTDGPSTSSTRNDVDHHAASATYFGGSSGVNWCGKDFDTGDDSTAAHLLGSLTSLHSEHNVPIYNTSLSPMFPKPPSAAELRQKYNLRLNTGNLSIANNNQENSPAPTVQQQTKNLIGQPLNPNYLYQNVVKKMASRPGPCKPKRTAACEQSLQDGIDSDLGSLEDLRALIAEASSPHLMRRSEASPQPRILSEHADSTLESGQSSSTTGNQPNTFFFSSPDEENVNKILNLADTSKPSKQDNQIKILQCSSDLLQLDSPEQNQVTVTKQDNNSNLRKHNGIETLQQEEIESLKNLNELADDLQDSKCGIPDSPKTQNHDTHFKTCDKVLPNSKNDVVSTCFTTDINNVSSISKNLELLEASEGSQPRCQSQIPVTPRTAPFCKSAANDEKIIKSELHQSNHSKSPRHKASRDSPLSPTVTTKIPVPKTRSHSAHSSNRKSPVGLTSVELKINRKEITGTIEFGDSPEEMLSEAELRSDCSLLSKSVLSSPTMSPPPHTEMMNYHPKTKLNEGGQKTTLPIPSHQKNQKIAIRETLKDSLKPVWLKRNLTNEISSQNLDSQTCANRVRVASPVFHDNSTDKPKTPLPAKNCKTKLDDGAKSSSKHKEKKFPETQTDQNIGKKSSRLKFHLLFGGHKKKHDEKDKNSKKTQKTSCTSVDNPVVLKDVIETPEFEEGCDEGFHKRLVPNAPSTPVMKLKQEMLSTSWLPLAAMPDDEEDFCSWDQPVSEQQPNIELQQHDSQIQPSKDGTEHGNGVIQQQNVESQQFFEDIPQINAAIQQSNGKIDQPNLEVQQLNTTVQQFDTVIKQISVDIQAPAEIQLSPEFMTVGQLLDISQDNPDVSKSIAGIATSKELNKSESLSSFESVDSPDDQLMFNENLSGSSCSSCCFEDEPSAEAMADVAAQDSNQCSSKLGCNPVERKFARSNSSPSKHKGIGLSNKPEYGFFSKDTVELTRRSIMEWDPTKIVERARLASQDHSMLSSEVTLTGIGSSDLALDSQMEIGSRPSGVMESHQFNGNPLQSSEKTILTSLSTSQQTSECQSFQLETTYNEELAPSKAKMLLHERVLEMEEWMMNQDSSTHEDTGAENEVEDSGWRDSSGHDETGNNSEELSLGAIYKEIKVVSDKNKVLRGAPTALNNNAPYSRTPLCDVQFERFGVSEIEAISQFDFLEDETGGSSTNSTPHKPGGPVKQYFELGQDQKPVDAGDIDSHTNAVNMCELTHKTPTAVDTHNQLSLPRKDNELTIDGISPTIKRLEAFFCDSSSSEQRLSLSDSLCGSSEDEEDTSAHQLDSLPADDNDQE